MSSGSASTESSEYDGYDNTGYEPSPEMLELMKKEQSHKRREEEFGAARRAFRDGENVVKRAKDAYFGRAERKPPTR